MANQDDWGGRRGPSEKQLSFIRSLQQRLALTNEQLDEIVREVCQVATLMELGRMEASTLIDDLLRRGQEAGVDTSPQAGVATEKQVKFMKSLKKKAKLDDAAFEKLILEVAKVKTPEEVPKKEASALIDKLLALTGQQPSPPKGGRGRGAPRGGAAPPAKKAEASEDRPPDRPGDGPTDEEDLPF